MPVTSPDEKHRVRDNSVLQQGVCAPRKDNIMLFILTSIMMAALVAIVLSCIVKVRETTKAIAASWAVVAVISEGPLGSSITSTTKVVRRWRIARDREGVASRNARCRRGHLPFLPNINGPNRAYRRRHDSLLQAEGKERQRQLSLSAERRKEEERRRAEEALRVAKEEERLRLLRIEKERERIAAYCAANTQRLRAERRWEKKGTPKSSSIRTKAVVKSAVTGEANRPSVNKLGLTKAQQRANNLERWENHFSKKKERKGSFLERRNWDLLQSRTFQAIASGDSSPETMALFHAARSAA